MSTPPKSILIILMGSIGDVARGIVLVDQLKAAYPQTKISWLVEPKSAAVVKLHPRIDSVVVFERGKGIHAVLSAIRAIRAVKPDLVLDLQRHSKSGLFSLLSGAPRRIGFHRSDAKEFNWVFSTEQIRARGENIPKIDHYLTFLEPLNIQPRFPLKFGIDEKVGELSNQSLKGKQFIAILLGSAWESKDWFAPGYLALIQKILSTLSYEVVLIGDSTRIKLAETLQNELKNSRVHSMVGATTLVELISVLKHAAVVVGPDSGPGHICGALGVPYISLFGATDPKRTAPFGSERLVLRSAVGCSPCYRRKCPGLGRLCMRLIAPESVFEMVRTTLQRV